MEEFKTIFDDISYELTNGLKESAQIVRDGLNAQCRFFAKQVILDDWSYYIDDDKEVREQRIGICFLVQLTHEIIESDPARFRGLNKIYEYLDTENYCEEVDKSKAIEVIREVYEKAYA